MRPLGSNPRVGGGNARHPPIGFDIEGLSPRGRGKRITAAYAAGRYRSIPAWAGKPPVAQRIAIGARSIPAWAGETNGRVNPNFKKKVYPRVGGGNVSSSSACSNARGLSPRGRGKLAVPAAADAPEGSIPAWAGGNQSTPTKSTVGDGLSPRGRGKRAAAAQARKSLRSIPAWAGETSQHARPARRRQVYPRVGGGNK